MNTAEAKVAAFVLIEAERAAWSLLTREEKIERMRAEIHAKYTKESKW